MFIAKSIIFITTAVMCIGCVPKHSEVPTPVNFETSQQPVIQAAHHWDLINTQVAKDLLDAVDRKVSKSERILIKPENSAYSQQLYYDVVKSMTAAGYKIIKNDVSKVSDYRYEYQSPPKLLNHDVLIELKTNVLKFSRDRKETAYTGVISSLAGGLWFLKVLDTSNWARGTAALGGLDVFNYFNNDKNFSDNPPQTEIVIDVVTSRNDEYISITKDIFYVIASDTSMYKAAVSREPLMREFAIKGGDRK